MSHESFPESYEHFSFRPEFDYGDRMFRLIVGNPNGALYSIGHFRLRVNLESTLHPARVWIRVNLETLESQPLVFA